MFVVTMYREGGARMRTKFVHTHTGAKQVARRNRCECFAIREGVWATTPKSYFKRVGTAKSGRWVEITSAEFGQLTQPEAKPETNKARGGVGRAKLLA